MKYRSLALSSSLRASVRDGSSLLPEPCRLHVREIQAGNVAICYPGMPLTLWVFLSSQNPGELTDYTGQFCNGYIPNGVTGSFNYKFLESNPGKPAYKVFRAGASGCRARHVILTAGFNISCRDMGKFACLPLMVVTHKPG